MGFSYELLYFKGEKWIPIKLMENKNNLYIGNDEGIGILFHLTSNSLGFDYTLTLNSEFKTRVRIMLKVLNEEELFHIIPNNIFGDNNVDLTTHNEFPHLTYKYNTEPFCNDEWEFRADRASHCVSMICTKDKTYAISVSPYSDIDNGYVKNGLVAKLPNEIGVSLGYKNFPFTFLEKGKFLSSTEHTLYKGTVNGKIYIADNHTIIRDLYYQTREIPVYEKSYEDAIKAIANAFKTVGYSEEYDSYRNAGINYSDNTIEGRRPLLEIGWTGGAIVGYPLLVAQDLYNIDFDNRPDGYEILDRISKCYNEKSGILYELTRPFKRKFQPFFRLGPGKENSLVNGWWAGYIMNDCHCSYTNGSALYYLLKAYDYCNTKALDRGENWLHIACKVLDTFCQLQKEDGNYGYTFSEDEKKVLELNGFGGCNVAAPMAYAYKITKKEAYLESAKKAASYYHSNFVLKNNCYGSPMDTFFAVDQEGILSFIRMCKILHQVTNDKLYINMMIDGVNFEYLWRYSYKARPDVAPLNKGWNSCGGSVTSVSNPHIHPMGVYITRELYYLYEQTNDKYHKDRADDAIAWAMQCLELFPDKTNCGVYGIMTERFCPSDGLLIEKYPDDTPCSIWLSFNGWAAAAILEGLVDKVLDIENDKE